MLDLAAYEPIIVGFVGNLRVGTKEFAGHLKRFGSNKLFRGIRLPSTENRLWEQLHQRRERWRPLRRRRSRFRAGGAGHRSAQWWRW